MIETILEEAMYVIFFIAIYVAKAKGISSTIS